MKWIYDLPYDQLKTGITGLNLKAFVADQVFQWIYAKNRQDLSTWSNVGNKTKTLLLENFDFDLLTVLKAETDTEGTQKLLVQLKDNQKVECVLIPERDHYTFCISSQVGCPLACAFCATGKLGFKRNLSPGEILCQVLLLQHRLNDHFGESNNGETYKGKINIVLMGMGEPLLNYQNLKLALDIIADDRYLAISTRRITLSTAGILDKIKQFEIDFPNIKISFSLNAPDARLREKLMPISKKENLNDIIRYFKTTRRKRRVTFEYVLLKGINDSLPDAVCVAEMLKGMACKINLIPYNENRNCEFKRPDRETVEAFSELLYSRGYAVMVRWSKGKDIKSACGQLAGG